MINISTAYHIESDDFNNQFHANYNTSLSRNNSSFPVLAGCVPSEMERFFCFFLKQVGVGDNPATGKSREARDNKI